jgi:hypothetical protein
VSKAKQSYETTQIRKKRRPNKKLKTNLDALVDALPEVSDQTALDDVTTLNTKRPRLKSLKSRPGAQKRKSKLEEAERRRFEQNLAQLTSAAKPSTSGIVTSIDAASSSVSSRWTALRGFISQTMEQKAEFVKK